MKCDILFIVIIFHQRNKCFQIITNMQSGMQSKSSTAADQWTQAKSSYTYCTMAYQWRAARYTIEVLQQCSLHHLEGQGQWTPHFTDVASCKQGVYMYVHGTKLVVTTWTVNISLSWPWHLWSLVYSFNSMHRNVIYVQWQNKYDLCDWM